MKHKEKSVKQQFGFREMFPADDVWGLGTSEEGEAARHGIEGPSEPGQRVFRFHPEGNRHPPKASGSGRKCAQICISERPQRAFWKHKENGLGDKIKRKRPVRKLLVKSN